MITTSRFLPIGLLAAAGAFVVGCESGLPSESAEVATDGSVNAGGQAGTGGTAGAGGHAGTGGSGRDASADSAAGKGGGGAAGAGGAGASAGQAGSAGTGGEGGQAGSAGTGGAGGTAGASGIGGYAGTDSGVLVCDTGQLRCTGTPALVLEGCRPDRSGWQTLDTCSTDSLCADTVSAEKAACVAPVCVDNQTQCSDKELQSCKPGRNGWQTLGLCATAELCQAGLASDGGVCPTPLCSAGQTLCDGVVFRACNQGQNGWDDTPCATEQLCKDGLALGSGTCAAPACGTGDLTCDTEGKVLLACNSDRNGWKTSQNCQYVCTSESGVANCGGVCMPGSRRCGANAVQDCQSNGQWNSGMQCNASEVCVANACMPCSGSGGPSPHGVPGGYCIDSTEVTRAQYDAWLANSPATTGQPSQCSWNFSFAPDPTCMANSSVCQTDCHNHPQVCVDWCDAFAYCQSVGKHLCGKIGGGPNAYADGADSSKSQWLAACSSGGKNTWTYGSSAWDENGLLCNDWGKKLGTTAQVGSFAGCTSSVAGYTGVYDLTGSVWEWEDSCDNNTGENDECRIRGGTWVNCFGWICDYAYNCDQCTYGAHFRRNVVDPAAGFRCCS